MIPGVKQGKVWGWTQLLFSKNNVEIHRIFSKKGCYCSLHEHKSKFNMFYVESGSLLIRTNKDNLDDETIIKEGEFTCVKPGDKHQFEALTDVYALEIYWIELESNDIKRYSRGGSSK